MFLAKSRLGFMYKTIFIKVKLGYVRLLGYVESIQLILAVIDKVYSLFFSHCNVIG